MTKTDHKTYSSSDYLWKELYALFMPITDDIQVRACREILLHLDAEDLFALIKTVSQNLVVVHQKQEAIDAVLFFSSSVEELLGRRKITKDVLYHYLISNGHKALPLSVDKVTLCLKVLETLQISPSKCGENADAGRGAAGDHSEGLLNLPQLAPAFIQWFFSALNRSSLDQPFSAQHFWPSCRLVCQALDGGSNQTSVRTANGGGSVASFFTDLICRDLLLFNPNLDSSSGWTAGEDSFGLISVGSCGTLLAGGDYLGVYQMLWQLIKDPDSNNYRISRVSIKIKVCSSIESGAAAPPLDIEGLQQMLQIEG